MFGMGGAGFGFGLFYFFSEPRDIWDSAIASLSASRGEDDNVFSSRSSVVGVLR